MAKKFEWKTFNNLQFKYKAYSIFLIFLAILLFSIGLVLITNSQTTEQNQNQNQNQNQETSGFAPLNIIGGIVFILISAGLTYYGYKIVTNPKNQKTCNTKIWNVTSCVAFPKITSENEDAVELGVTLCAAQTKAEYEGFAGFYSKSNTEVTNSLDVMYISSDTRQIEIESNGTDNLYTIKSGENKVKLIGECYSPCPSGTIRSSPGAPCLSPCPRGQTRNSSGECTSRTSSTSRCDPGYVRSTIRGECVPAPESTVVLQDLIDNISNLKEIYTNGREMFFIDNNNLKSFDLYDTTTTKNIYPSMTTAVDLTLDPDMNNVYIVEYLNRSRIIKVTHDLQVSYINITNTSNDLSDSYVSIAINNDSSKFYLASIINVYSLPYAGGNLTTLFTETDDNSTISDIAIDKDGNYLYVCNNLTKKIKRINLSDNTVSTIIEFGKTIRRISLHPNNNQLFVLTGVGIGQSLFNEHIYIVNLTTYELDKTILLEHLSFNTPYSMCIDPNGAFLYVSNQTKIKKIQLYGTCTNSVSLGEAICAPSCQTGQVRNIYGRCKTIPNEFQENTTPIDTQQQQQDTMTQITNTANAALGIAPATVSSSTPTVQPAPVTYSDISGIYSNGTDTYDFNGVHTSTSGCILLNTNNSLSYRRDTNTEIFASGGIIITILVDQNNITTSIQISGTNYNRTGNSTSTYRDISGLYYAVGMSNGILLSYEFNGVHTSKCGTMYQSLTSIGTQSVPVFYRRTSETNISFTDGALGNLRTGTIFFNSSGVPTKITFTDNETTFLLRQSPSQSQNTISQIVNKTYNKLNNCGLLPLINFIEENSVIYAKYHLVNLNYYYSIHSCSIHGQFIISKTTPDLRSIGIFYLSENNRIINIKPFTWSNNFLFIFNFQFNANDEFIDSSTCPGRT